VHETHKHTCVYTRIQLHTYTYKGTYTRVRAYTHTHTCTHAHTHAHPRTCTCARTHAPLNTAPCAGLCSEGHGTEQQGPAGQRGPTPPDGGWASCAQGGRALRTHVNPVCEVGCWVASLPACQPAAWVGSYAAFHLLRSARLRGFAPSVLATVRRMF